jgi:hypothetical protein
MSEPWSRQEKIDFSRGVLQFLGIMILIFMMVYILKYRAVMGKECGYALPNGSVVDTGLYGNCQWIREYKGRYCETTTTNPT